MKYLVPLLNLLPLVMAVLPAASLAQSKPADTSGVPSVAIPKTTAVIVIETAKQGITPQ